MSDDEGWLRLKIGANSEINLKVLLEIRFLQPIKGARSGAKKSFNASNSNNPKGELVNEPEKLCNLEQNRTEQKRTEHNTTEQTRAETDDAAAAQSGVVVVCGFADLSDESLKAWQRRAKRRKSSA